MKGGILAQSWQKADPFASGITVLWIAIHLLVHLVTLSDRHLPEKQLRVAVSALPRTFSAVLIEILILTALSRGKPYAFWFFFVFDIFILANTAAYRFGGVASIWADRTTPWLLYQVIFMSYCAIRILQIKTEKDKVKLTI